MLDNHSPAKARKPLDRSLDNEGVPLVDQPGQLRPTPAGFDLDAHLQGRCDPAQGLQRQSIEPTGLDSRHGLLADSGDSRDIDLSQHAPAPDGPED
jgi:hypothetical protein